MKSVKRALMASAIVAGLVVGALGVPAVAGKVKTAPLKGEGEGLEIVANIPYAGGSDMEYTTIKGHDYAFATQMPGADGGGLHVINIDNPEKPVEVDFAPCAVSQGDIQISWNNKYAYVAADGAGGPDSCLAVGKLGFLIYDISNPKSIKNIGFAETHGGSHNITAHPTKPYVYNSNSELVPMPEIEIWNVKNPKAPELVGTAPSAPHAPHDISFNEDGSLAVTAAVSHFDLFDTSDPEAPVLLFEGQCPGCSITHDAKFLPDSSGLLIGDEGGGGLAYPCPGGQLHFYSLQQGRVPVYQGVYAPDEFVLARDGQGGPQGCTSHVMEVSDDGSTVAISWYSAGTRYLNIESMMGAALGGNSVPGGVTELGWFMPEGGNSWSSKFLNSDGKYIFSNDINRGFDVFKITG